MTESALAPRASWFVRSAALVGVVLIVVGVVVAVAGQRLLSAESRPPKQYIDGRYWTIAPGACTALGADTKAACMALDTAEARKNERAHENLVTIRSMGIVSVLTGVALVFVGFVGTRRAAQESNSLDRAGAIQS
jgi:hypothetical protein